MGTVTCHFGYPAVVASHLTAVNAKNADSRKPPLVIHFQNLILAVVVKEPGSSWS